MNVTITERKPTTVAYLRHEGAYGDSVAKFWQDEVYPWMVTENLLGRPRYGVSHDDPSITAPKKCRYDACVEVPPTFAVSGRAQKTTLPGGRFATTPFSGTALEVAEVWADLLRSWLPASGYQLDAKPFFEYYPADAKHDAERGTFECRICIPIAPL